MKISLSWLKEHLRTDKPASEIARILTDAGLEVGAVESNGVTTAKVVAARILESVQHPNADRLSVCKVDDGSGAPRQIVCGAKNYKVGDKVPLAQPGAVMPGDFKIKVGKLRGVESEGMMCSSKELGLGEGAQGDVGLLILDPATTIGTPLTELFPAEEVFEIEITPNRPDWLGHLGVAREAAAFGCGELISPTPALPPTKEDASVAAIAAPDASSFYSIRRIDGVKVAPSPEWLRKRLESVGLRPINNIVDITNFVMFETGQPLHAFDAGTVAGALGVRMAAEGEKFTALDGSEHQLTPSDPVIADSKGVQGVLALAGITGGKASGVSDGTTSILLESAVFTPGVIRRAARAHGLSTDSSYRFERGVDAAGALAASARATALILESAGGTAASELAIAGSLPAPRVVALRGDRVRSLLGIDLDDDGIAALLAKLGLRQLPDGFEIPAWRNDLTREVDLIEEVARLHGIGNITSRLHAGAALSSDADRSYDFALGLRRRLAGAGFHEARSGTLTGSRDQEAFSTGGVIAVRNPMGEEHSTLRASLIPGLLDAVSRNLRHGAESVRLFEIGRVYQTPEKNKPEERLRLGLVMTGRDHGENWRGEPARPLDLFDLKGVLSRFGAVTFRAASHARLPLALEILISGKPAGLLGILSPADAREVMVGGHQGQILVAELDLAPLEKSSAAVSKGSAALPKFPSVRRDLALLLDAAVPYAVVEESALAAKEELLTGITPFDIFSDPKGEKVPLGKKSLAVALTFQHAERTLTTEEVNDALARIVTRLRESAGAEIRG
jgi:phenylalanyl-tRNA synthetase beta chain